MNVILKTSLKNIFGKPLRTLLVVFSIFVCTICAFLSFDLCDSMGAVLSTFYGNVSDADFLAVAAGSDLSELPEDYPECNYMSMSRNGEMIYEKIDGEYCYVTSNSLTIFGLDVDEAVAMRFMPEMDVKDGEIFVSEAASEAFGYKIGDKITIHDRAGEELELTIGGIFPEETKNPILQGTVGIVNRSTGINIACGVDEADLLLIDVTDDSKIEEAKDLLAFAYPDITTQDLSLSESDLAVLNDLKAVFYLLFAITFLLVIFVTFSICNRIVSERMSFIGTLRSLGMSSGRTCGILLLENILYSILGSIPAALMYAVIRDIILTAMFSISGELQLGVEIPKLSPVVVICVVLGSIVVECLIPIKAILKALKTSIRDIIFDNRDTSYQFSRTSLIVGLVFLGIAVITAFFCKIFLMAIVCIVAAVTSLALLFPHILKLIASGIHKFADKHDKSALSLAASETISRKSTVGSGVLSATAAAMCVLVYTVANCLAGTITENPYNCDVMVEAPLENIKYYSYIDYIEGVEDTEAIYYSNIEVSYEDGAPLVSAFFALPEDGFKYYNEFKNLPETIENGNVVVSKTFSNRNGVKPGDKIKLSVNSNMLFPIVREYTVQDVVECTLFEGLDVFIVPMNEYQALFNDRPGEILIKCADADAVKKTIETYGKGSFTQIMTFQEYVEQSEKNNASTVAIVTAVLVIAIAMTAIGMITNQLLGFEGRKKECAVMLSTAMNKGKLSGILLREVLITSVSASAVGTIVGTLLLLVTEAAFKHTDYLYVEMDINPLTSLVFFVLLTLIFTLTVLFPIKNLKKMKIAEQIKYE